MKGLWDETGTGDEIRARLNHPVIDGDGHIFEIPALLPDFIRQVAGPDVLKKWEERGTGSLLQAPQGGHYLAPSGVRTIDRAVAQLPRLRLECHERAGIDFAIIYPTVGLQMVSIADDELRRAMCRAYNLMVADIFAGYESRMIPSMLVPLFTPEEAIEELTFAATELGARTITINGYVQLPSAELARTAPELARYSKELHPLAVDALHDYDPFWQACIDLKVTPACHGSSMATHRHNSMTNQVFNHLNTFSHHMEYLCRTLFMGGVTRRFPALNVGFLEGGVSWACQLYNDICEHWEKRNKDALAENLDPKKVDIPLLEELFAEYGDDTMTPALIRADSQERIEAARHIQETPDDFARCGIAGLDDIERLFTRGFYFGCEADDRMIAVAFDDRLHHCGARFKPMLGSDIGHWDVPDSTKVLNAAYEMVEEGVLSDADFEAFVFGNAVRFHTGMNPDFFEGTSVADAARRAMAANV